MMLASCYQYLVSLFCIYKVNRIAAIFLPADLPDKRIGAIFLCVISTMKRIGAIFCYSFLQKFLHRCQFPLPIR